MYNTRQEMIKDLIKSSCAYFFVLVGYFVLFFVVKMDNIAKTLDTTFLKMKEANEIMFTNLYDFYTFIFTKAGALRVSVFLLAGMLFSIGFIFLVKKSNNVSLIRILAVCKLAFLGFNCCFHIINNAYDLRNDELLN